MTNSVNKAIIVGNVGRDPEIRTTQDGTKVVNMSVATSETWNDRASGERKERTEWHRIAVFNDRIAEFIEAHVKKGAKVYVEGALQTRKWTDQSGAEKYSTEIVIGRFDGRVTLLSRGGEQSHAPAEPATQQATAPKRGDLDDEIPF